MIITLAQVKSLLNITNTNSDTLISALIPEAEAKYLQIRNIPFLQITASASSGDKTLSNILVYPGQDFSTESMSVKYYSNESESCPVKNLLTLKY